MSLDEAAVLNSSASLTRMIAKTRRRFS
jgi:hypothetical protein